MTGVSARSTDILVIGAGPAGCAAAITAAAAGLSVALVEGSMFPRERPGETLHPGVEPLFERLGVAESVRAAGFPRYAGHWVQWGTAPPRFEAFGADVNGPWLGFHAWRAELDSLLLAEALRRDARLFQPCRALRPLVEAGRVQGALTDQGPLRAAIVVDATGGKRWLARHLGLSARVASPRRIVYFGYLRGQWEEREAAPLLCGDRAGWLWVAGVRPGLTAWTRLLLASNSRDNLPPGVERGLCPDGKPIRGEDATWRIVDTSAGPGFFLVGDTASVLDPLSSHGVLKALMTGMQAARSAGRILQSGQSEEKETGSYAAWIQQWFLHDCLRLEEIYSQLLV